MSTQNSQYNPAQSDSLQNDNNEDYDTLIQMLQHRLGDNYHQTLTKSPEN